MPPPDLPPLPPGFTLDQAGGMPPLPPGFTLDSAQQSERAFVGPTQEQARRPIDRATAAARSLVHGLTLGAAPGMSAGARMAEERDLPLTQQTQNALDIYRTQLAHDRERLAAGRSAYPLTSAAAEIGGAVAGSLALPGASTVLGNIGQGAAIGGAYGYNDTGSVKEAAKGAAIGGATAGVASAVASRFVRNKPPAAPSIEELKAASRAAYEAADAVGDIVPQRALQDTVTRVEQMLADEGFRPGLNPATAEALKALSEDASKQGVVGSTMNGIEGLRRVLLNAEGAAGSRADARLAGKVLDEFDDAMEAAVPAGTAKYKEARALFTRLRKAQDIQALFEKAENAAGGYTQSGFENTLRIQFRQLADNPKRFNRFSPAEKEAILKVVRGGPIQGAIRFLGKFAARGPVSAMATGMLGGLVGGPGGAVALGAVGEGARAVAGGMRTGAANRVSELVRAGGAPVAAAAGSRALPQLGYVPAAALPAANALANQDRYRNALAK